MLEMLEEITAALEACASLNDADVASVSARFKTVAQVCNCIKTLEMRLLSASDNGAGRKLAHTRLDMQAIKQVIVRSQRISHGHHHRHQQMMHEHDFGFQAQASFENLSAQLPMRRTSVAQGNSSKAAASEQIPETTAIQEVMGTLLAAAQWCADLIRVEGLQSPVTSPRSAMLQSQLSYNSPRSGVFPPKFSWRYHCLQAQMDHIIEIEKALTMLSQISVNMTVESDSDYCIAIEWVKRCLSDVALHMGCEGAGNQAPLSPITTTRFRLDASAISSFNDEGFNNGPPKPALLVPDSAAALERYKKDLQNQKEAQQSLEIQQRHLAENICALLNAQVAEFNNNALLLQQQMIQMKQNYICRMPECTIHTGLQKSMLKPQQLKKLQKHQQKQHQLQQEARIAALMQKQQRLQQQINNGCGFGGKTKGIQNLQGHFTPSQVQQDANNLFQDLPVASSRSELPRLYALGRCSNARYAELDQHALNCPVSCTTSVSTLTAYLLQVAKSDEERARVLTRWIVENISYDFEALRTGNRSAVNAATVLRERTAVCDGYVCLLVDLLRQAGLRAERISGCGKGISWSEDGQTVPTSNHAWVAVKLGGLTGDPDCIDPTSASNLDAYDPTAPMRSGSSKPSWFLIDPCWASGVGKTQVGQLVFQKKYHDVYFLTRPELFVLDHLPMEEGAAWQLMPLADIVSIASFQASQGKARYGWRPVSHPLISISMSASEFSQQNLKIRLELCMPLVRGKHSPSLRVYRAVGGPGGAYSRGDLVGNVDGIGRVGDSASSDFQLSVCFVEGAPHALEYCVKCGWAASYLSGSVFRVEVRLWSDTGTGGISQPYTASEAIYILKVT